MHSSGGGGRDLGFKICAKLQSYFLSLSLFVCFLFGRSMNAYKAIHLAGYIGYMNIVFTDRTIRIWAAADSINVCGDIFFIAQIVTMPERPLLLTGIVFRKCNDPDAWVTAFSLGFPTRADEIVRPWHFIKTNRIKQQQQQHPSHMTLCIKTSFHPQNILKVL